MPNALSRKLKCSFAELYIQLCTFYRSKETGKSEWVRFFMCIAYKKHVKHAQVEPELSSSVLERQSQKIFSLFPKEVQSIFK